MPITPEEEGAIRILLRSLDDEVNIILAVREDVFALLRIHGSIDDDAIENAILHDAKGRAKAAAEELVTLLT